MNKELFRSMQAQLRPSEGARAALTEKLRAGRRRTAALFWRTTSSGRS